MGESDTHHWQKIHKQLLTPTSGGVIVVLFDGSLRLHMLSWTTIHDEGSRSENTSSLLHSKKCRWYILYIILSSVLVRYLRTNFTTSVHTGDSFPLPGIYDWRCSHHDDTSIIEVHFKEPGTWGVRSRRAMASMVFALSRTLKNIKYIQQHADQSKMTWAIRLFSNGSTCRFVYLRLSIIFLEENPHVT